MLKPGGFSSLPPERFNMQKMKSYGFKTQRLAWSVPETLFVMALRRKERLKTLGLHSLELSVDSKN